MVISKKMMNIVKIFLIVALVLFTVSAFVYPVSAFQPSEVEINNDPPGGEGLNTVGGAIIGILQTVGVILSIAVLVVLGIKYMMGSPEEKSEYKKTMIPYVVGAVLIFTASVLAQVIYDFFTGITL